MHAGMWPEFEYELGEVRVAIRGLCFASLVINSEILNLYVLQYIVTITLTHGPVSYALYWNVIGYVCFISMCSSL